MSGQEYRGNEGPRGSKGANRTRLFGIVLLAVALLLWVAVPAVVLTPLSAGQKVWASSAFLVLGEVAFWVAALALGRGALRRYGRSLDPRDWFGRGRR